MLLNASLSLFTSLQYTMFINRLKKNLKHLKRWCQRENITCYRAYDADIPEYAVAVDVYESKKRWLHVQEYEAPKSVDSDRAKQRLQHVMECLREVFSIEQDQLFVKVRRQQKGKSQYDKLSSQGKFHQISEGGYQFWVNFSDYLDTGLFLDHRLTRAMIGKYAKHKNFLNLFAYTGSVSVYAAKGGAASTTTIDMSNTYLNWAKRNMTLNGMQGNEHQFIQSDCLQWLEQTAQQHYFDLIFLDPPSYSSSKRMQGTLDIQRDHVALINKTVSLLKPNGILIFSNNLRRFKMDLTSLSALHIENISKTTLPKDFERNPRIHNCWKICPTS